MAPLAALRQEPEPPLVDACVAAVRRLERVRAEGDGGPAGPDARYRRVGALVDALARPPLGGQPRADFANGRNRLNREGTASRGEDMPSGAGELRLAIALPPRAAP